MVDRREEILSEQLGRYLLKISHISHGTDAIPHAIKLAMDEYMKECCLELLEYMAKYNIRIAFNSANQPIFRYKEEWISKEQLFENFL